MTHDSLTLTIRDQSSLYNALTCPFFVRAACLCRQELRYQLGDHVSIRLTLLDEPEPRTISGRVVWITPKGAQGQREAGIGVEFSEQDASVSHQIENYLGGSLTSPKFTQTL